jgi:sugar/nucleoside kinase (ribokinase family)
VGLSNVRPVAGGPRVGRNAYAAERLAAPMPPEDPQAGRLDLVVAGHVNIDHFLHVARMPTRERTVPLTGRATALGGPGGTLARIAARHGVKVGLIARVGEDLPAAFREELRRDGVDLSGLETVPGAYSPACYIFEDGRGHQMTVIDQGPMGTAAGAAVPEALLVRAGWLHLTTGDPAFLLRLKRAARERGLRVAVDPAQEVHYRWTRRPLEELLSGAEMVFGNVAEIARMRTLLRLPSDEALLDRVPLVLRTEGAAGVTAFSRAGTTHVPAARLRRRAKVTGAGDAFRGGFYAAFFRGEPLQNAMRAGTVAAAEWMQRKG